MVPIHNHLDITPASIRRRSTFFSHKNTQEPTLKSVKCRLFSRNNYYLNINSKGNIVGTTKRELQEKLLKNKIERDLKEENMKNIKFNDPLSNGTPKLATQSQVSFNQQNALEEI